MILYVFLFFVGLLLLYLGAEGLIQGASSIALQYGIRPVILGLTVVALGTSMPEYLVNVFALISGESPLAIGNIIGSNISNVALILGACAVVLPLAVTPEVLRREYPVMLGVMVLFYLCALDGVIGARDGIVMVILLSGLAAYVFYDAHQTTRGTVLESMEGELDAADPELSTLAKTVYVMGGMGGLTLGAHLMVDNALAISDVLNIDHVVIGLTVVAIGTSLPELAASMVGTLKQEVDMTVGNVIGSNLLNVLFVVGTLAIAEPITVDPETIRLHFPVMIGFCALVVPLTWWDQRITRMKGAFMVVAFLGFMVFLYV
ncbi:calcium/sodium antiporter [Salinibacter altiplanensis]|uniref:calcium/sodium antiporter n=1 Tax=Salinibacter altiplanensis TaxID=1803181 RepID=UPI000C9F1853|nr:calcium/sodium antiporter [Salinibacter altiplanensis]